MGQEYNQSGARKLILIHFQSIVYQCFKSFIILTMESLSLRPIQLKLAEMAGFFLLYAILARWLKCDVCFFYHR
jgi:hypothetical protein